MNKNDPRVIKTLRQIDEAMLTLLELHSYREITLSMLCQQALINKTTFYKYYVNKSDYINQYMDRLLEAFRAHLNVDFILAPPSEIDNEFYQKQFQDLMDFVQRNKREFCILWHARIDRQLYNEMTDALYDMMLEKIQRSQAYTDVKPEYLELYAHLFSTHAMALFHWWFDHDTEVTAQEVVFLMKENMKHGFFMAFDRLK